MTDERIIEIAAKSGIGPNSGLEFARSIRAATLWEAERALIEKHEDVKRKGYKTIANWVRECIETVRALKELK